MANQVEGNGSACQCQILGILPIMWHWKNCESDCRRWNLKQRKDQEKGWLSSREMPSLRMRN